MKLPIYLLLFFMIFVPANSADTLSFAHLGTAPFDVTFIVLEKAYNNIGVNIKPIHLTAETAIQLTNLGDVDGEIFRIKGLDKQFENLIMVDAPVYRLEICCFTKLILDDNPGWDVFNNYHTGVTLGIKLYDTKIKSVQVTKLAKSEHLFHMLADDRIEMVAHAYLSGIGVFNHVNHDGINIYKLNIPPILGYHYLHKKHAELVPQLEAELRKMWNSGKIEKIKSDYIRENFKFIK